MAMKTWNVRVTRNGKELHIGQVNESDETLARCAALSRFGVSEEDVKAEGVCGAGIHSDEDFEVTLAI